MEIGIKNQFLEKPEVGILNSDITDLILAMTVYLPV